MAACKLLGSINVRNVLTEQLLASQAGICSTESGGTVLSI